jgi:hypothetical protein
MQIQKANCSELFSQYRGNNTLPHSTIIWGGGGIVLQMGLNTLIDSYISNTRSILLLCTCGKVSAANQYVPGGGAQISVMPILCTLQL